MIRDERAVVPGPGTDPLGRPPTMTVPYSVGC